MPCYQCSHCNKCGIFSVKLDLTCANCGADILPGKNTCPTCGAPYSSNMKRGKLGKPAGAKDWFTELDDYLKQEANGSA